jgi:hypothetical protein
MAAKSAAEVRLAHRAAFERGSRSRYTFFTMMPARGTRLRVAGLVAAAGALLATCTPFSDDGGGDGAREAGTSSDAGSDSKSSPLDDASTPFCASLTTPSALCADFDHGGPARFGFDDEYGAVTVDTGRAVSAPASLLATVTQVDESAYLLRSFTKTYPTSHRVSLAIRPEASGDGGAGPTGWVVLLNVNGCECNLRAGATWQVRMDNRRDGGSNWTERTLLRYPLVGAWTSLDMTLTRRADGVWMAVDVDGQEAVAPTLTTCPDLDGTPLLTVGLKYATPGQVRFDNVVFDAK